MALPGEQGDRVTVGLPLAGKELMGDGPGLQEAGEVYLQLPLPAPPATQIKAMANVTASTTM